MSISRAKSSTSKKSTRVRTMNKPFPQDHLCRFLLAGNRRCQRVRGCTGSGLCILHDRQLMQLRDAESTLLRRCGSRQSHRFQLRHRHPRSPLPSRHPRTPTPLHHQRSLRLHLRHPIPPPNSRRSRLRNPPPTGPRFPRSLRRPSHRQRTLSPPTPPAHAESPSSRSTSKNS